MNLLACLTFCLIWQVRGQKFGDPCEDKDAGHNGTCLLFRHCSWAKSRYDRGQFYKRCTAHYGYSIVCCPNPETSTEPTLFPKKTIEQRISIPKTSRQKCEEYSAKARYFLPARMDITDKIVGGRNASNGEFPHVAALGFWSIAHRKIEWGCGGTLISETYVLTAAHCLQSREYGNLTFVRLGEVDLTEFASRTLQDFQIPASSRIRHPDYNPPNKYHDIALVKLPREAVFNENVLPACLFQPDDDLTPYEINGFTATGWGIVNDSLVTSDVLQQVQLSLFPDEGCLTNYNSTSKRLLSEGIRSEYQLCAGGTTNLSKDTCLGDSGGPLEVSVPDRRLPSVVGVTSFGKVCGAIHVPGVYVRVSRYVKWIESIVWA